MKVSRVEEELIEGVLALDNLLHQLERVLEEAHFPLEIDTYGGRDYIGYYFTKDEDYRQEFWCGMIYTEPQYLIFQYTESLRSRVGPVIDDVDLEKYPMHPETEDEQKKYWRVLPFRERGFFSMNASDQIKEIKAFVEACVTPTTTDGN